MAECDGQTFRYHANRLHLLAPAPVPAGGHDGGSVTMTAEARMRMALGRRAAGRLAESQTRPVIWP